MFEIEKNLAELHELTGSDSEYYPGMRRHDHHFYCQSSLREIMEDEIRYRVQQESAEASTRSKAKCFLCFSNKNGGALSYRLDFFFFNESHHREMTDFKIYFLTSDNERYCIETDKIHKGSSTIDNYVFIDSAYIDIPQEIADNVISPNTKVSIRFDHLDIRGELKIWFKGLPQIFQIVVNPSRLTDDEIDDLYDLCSDGIKSFAIEEQKKYEKIEEERKEIEKKRHQEESRKRAEMVKRDINCKEDGIVGHADNDYQYFFELFSNPASIKEYVDLKSLVETEHFNSKLVDLLENDNLRKKILIFMKRNRVMGKVLPIVKWCFILIAGLGLLLYGCDGGFMDLLDKKYDGLFNNFFRAIFCYIGWLLFWAIGAIVCSHYAQKAKSIHSNFRSKFNSLDLGNY